MSPKTPYLPTKATARNIKAEMDTIATSRAQKEFVLNSNNLNGVILSFVFIPQILRLYLVPSFTYSIVFSPGVTEYV